METETMTDNTFTDVQAMHRKHPETFDAPTPSDLEHPCAS
jgi:hypothetical protein